MLSKEAIQRTCVTYWSDEEKCFVAESTLFECVGGVGDQEKTARENFEEMLADVYQEYEAGTLAEDSLGKPKYPSRLEADVKPETLYGITHLAELLGISNGEAIDHMVHFFQMTRAKQI